MARIRKSSSWWTSDLFAKLPGNWRIHSRFDQHEMDQFYAQIDVLLFMSQWKETFGLAIREALARGIKVIQTDSGGTTEHAAASAATLIPIGAPATLLRDQIIDTLVQHPEYHPPVQVNGYVAQAAAFHEIANDVLARA